MTEIYGLCDPDTGEIRYVGKAKNSQKRFKQHIAERHTKRPVYTWIRGLIESGKAPVCKVLEVVPDQEWESAERRLIAEHRKTSKLLNLADGGAMPSQTLSQRRAACARSRQVQAQKSPAEQKVAKANFEMSRLLARFMNNGDYIHAYKLRFFMKAYYAVDPKRHTAWASL